MLGRAEQWTDHLPRSYADLENYVQGRYKGHQGLCILCFTVISRTWLFYKYIFKDTVMNLPAYASPKHGWRGASFSGSGTRRTVESLATRFHLFVLSKGGPCTHRYFHFPYEMKRCVHGPRAFPISDLAKLLKKLFSTYIYKFHCSVLFFNCWLLDT